MGNRGGKRKGSGAKKKAPTRVLSFRVLKSKADELKPKIEQLIVKEDATN